MQHEGDFCGELLETLVHRLHDRADCRGRRRRGGLRGTEELSQELKANYRAPGCNGSFEFWFRPPLDSAVCDLSATAVAADSR